MSTGLEIIPPRSRGGRSLYNPAYCERAIELAAEGCGKAEIAAALGVAAKTLTAWTKAHEDFREAMTRAKELEYAWWLAAGRKGQFMRGWNSSGWALQMRNRFRNRFRERLTAGRKAEPRDSVNAEQIREEIEQRLSRLVDAGREEDISCEPEPQAIGESQV